MKSIEKWLSEYGETHRHPTNIAIHKVAIPSIIFSLLGMLWKIKFPSLGINGAMVLTALSLGYYALLSPRLCIGMTGVAGAMLAFARWLDLNSSTPLMKVSAGLFVAAWVMQFVGHKIEGKKPSFFKDLQFLLIGPLWTLNHYYKIMGIGIKPYIHIRQRMNAHISEVNYKKKHKVISHANSNDKIHKNKVNTLILYEQTSSNLPQLSSSVVTSDNKNESRGWIKHKESLRSL